MKNAQRIVVIGAGVIGSSVAWHLAALGAAVTVVEADQPGAGTSSTSFAWVNASSKIASSDDYFRLNGMALREHRLIAEGEGEDAAFHPTGDIEVAADAAAATRLQAKVEALQHQGYDAELLTAEALQRLEPGTLMPPEGACAFYGQEGWVDVTVLMRYLVQQATESGVQFLTADPARAVLRQGGGVTGVRLTSGEVLDADSVVTALGRWTSAFAAAHDIEVPLVDTRRAGSPAVGLLARVRLPGLPPQRLLHSQAVNWSPLRGGQALLASEAGDIAVARNASPAQRRRAAKTLVEKAAALNPLFAGAQLEHAQIGLRALPVDGEAICGWAPGAEGLYVVVTHSGVTLAPLLGRLAAGEILGGLPEAALAAFRPHRFAAQPAG